MRNHVEVTLLIRDEMYDRIVALCGWGESVEDRLDGLIADGVDMEESRLRRLARDLAAEDDLPF